MEINQSLCLKIIVDKWMTISKQVAIALHRLANGYSKYSVGEMFGIAACTSAKIFKMFGKISFNCHNTFIFKVAGISRVGQCKLGL